MVRAVLILIVSTLLLTAATTPMVYSLLLWLYPHFPWPFSRTFDRIAMVYVVLGLLALRREFHLESVRDLFPKFGAGWSGPGSLLAYGLLFSFLGLVPVIPCLFEQGLFVHSDRSSSSIAIKLVKLIPIALLIAFIEETFFRGVLFVNLKQKLGLIPGVVISSLIYALVHFIAPVKSFEVAGASPLNGFLYLGVVLQRFVDPAIIPGVFGLFLVGCVLAIVLEQSESLLPSIGFHAGWVVAIKLFSYSTVPGPALQDVPALTRRYLLVAEPITWLGVVLSLLFFLGVWRFKDREA